LFSENKVILFTEVQSDFCIFHYHHLQSKQDSMMRDEINHEQSIPSQAAVRDTVGLRIAGQVPDDQGLVTRGGQQGVRGVQRGRDSGNPTGVALQGAAVSESFSSLSGYANKKKR
jgi:hypothetical protein